MKPPLPSGGTLRTLLHAVTVLTTVTAVGLLVATVPQRAAARPQLTGWRSYDAGSAGTAPPSPPPNLLSGILGSTPTAPTPAPAPAPSSGARTSAPPPGWPPGLPVPPARTSAAPGPGRIWTLTASKLVLSGSQFHGYAAQQVCGTPVQTLHFTVSALHVTDLVQRGQLMDHEMVTAAGAPGSVSTVLNGPAELYTVSLTGTLNVLGFPLVRFTLSPNGFFPPNLDLSFLKQPDLTFTDVIARNVDLAGGDLHIPGAHIVTSQNDTSRCP